MKKNIDDLRKLVSKKEKILINLKNDFKNKIKIVLKRIKKNVDNTYKYSLSNFITELLPNIDNLEKAIILSKKENINFNEIHDELKVMLKLFLNLFKTYQISVIDKINIPFDPTIHQAIVLSNSKTVESNYVIEIMQKGYKIHERLLRPAMVVVSK